MCAPLPKKKVVTLVVEDVNGAPEFDSHDEDHFVRFTSTFRWLCNDWMHKSMPVPEIPRKMFELIFMSSYDTYWSNVGGNVFFCVDPFASVLAFLVGSGAPLSLRRLFWCLFFPAPEFDAFGQLPARHPYVTLVNAIGNVSAAVLLSNGAFRSMSDFTLENYIGIIPWPYPGIRYEMTRRVNTNLLVTDGEGFPVDWDNTDVANPETIS